VLTPDNNIYDGAVAKTPPDTMVDKASMITLDYTGNVARIPGLPFHCH